MTGYDAAERLPQTKHGRYVLNIARLWHWAAFDVNDILQIESESRRATVDRIRLGLASAGFGKDGYDIEETHAILDQEAAR